MAKDFMDSGKLVPDEVIIGIVSSQDKLVFRVCVCVCVCVYMLLCAITRETTDVH
jgi:hypothetical protein